jgi:hypothetical protein
MTVGCRFHFVKPMVFCRPSSRCRTYLACFAAVSAYIITGAHAQSASPSPSAYGVCKGRNVPYQFNLRPEFFVAVGGVSAGAQLELRLCIGAASSVANVGLKSLTLDVSNDGTLSVVFLTYFYLYRLSIPQHACKPRDRRSLHYCIQPERQWGVVSVSVGV